LLSQFVLPAGLCHQKLSPILCKQNEDAARFLKKMWNFGAQDAFAVREGDFRVFINSSKYDKISDGWPRDADADPFFVLN
jgi:hypothetical protein